MKTISVSSSDNLIKFPERFGGQYDANETPHEVAHPASRHYPHEDDFIAQMLETEPLIDEAPREEERIKDYIHCRQQELQKFLERDDSAVTASALLLLKTQRLNEFAKRIKFYLDDLDDQHDFED